MIDAARIIIITVGARALVADDIIQVKAHTWGNAAADDDNACNLYFLGPVQADRCDDNIF